jgi:chaperone protein EcpD
MFGSICSGLASRLLILSALIIPLTSQASIVLSGTRVIYPASEKEVTVKVTNPGKSPVLVQSWVDKGNVADKPDNIQVPFILLPPVNRINPGKGQTLRLSYTARPVLPENIESVYWLNVLEIPPVAKSSANHLQMAFRSRIKIFYRPAAIDDPAKVEAAMKKLTWSIEGGELKARNDSPYFVSLASITVKAAGHSSMIDGEMVPPMGSRTFHLNNSSLLHTGASITWEYINDWGAVGSASSPL